MSEMRSENPDRSVSSYSGSSVDVGAKVKVLLASMDPPVRAAIEALAKADDATRRQVLDSVDATTRRSLETILQHMP